MTQTKKGQNTESHQACLKDRVVTDFDKVKAFKDWNISDFDFAHAESLAHKPITAEGIARTMKIQRVHQMARAISRARKQAGDTFPKPEIKVCSIEEMPKELYDKFFKNEEERTDTQATRR